MVPNCEHEIMGGDCGNELLDAHNVRVIGNGSQVLVLGHGFGSDQSVWQFILPYFVNDYKVVLFDLMGAGSTKSHNFSFARYATLHGYADDLLMILDEMEIESCVFVGHSMSGMIACIASIERPQVFQKLVLLSASPR
jgi:pimeloyl-ACP methyl ester carboxylesterase